MRSRGLSPSVLITVAALLGVAALSLEPAAQVPAVLVSDVFANAIAERDLLPAAEGSLWRFDGPRNLGKGAINFFGISPFSGRINEVAVYPGDPQIMYATGATGGVWKTTDGGNQWAARSTGWLTQGATAVAVDRVNPNRVFVGTGDYKRLDHVPPFSVGVMRSLDGGATWQRFGTAEMRPYTVSRIVIDALDTDKLFAATGRGSRLPGGRVFQSSDGGVNWNDANLPDANWDDLESCGQGVLWASATRFDDPDPSSASGLIYRSTNHGLSWDPVTLTTPGGFALASVLSETIQIACDLQAATVFVAAYLNGGARVFSTSDLGSNWTEVTAAPIDVEGNPWAHAAMAVRSNALYVGGVRMFRGTPAAAGQFVFVELAGPLLHNDFQCAVPDPSEADALYLCTDGGIYRHRASVDDSTPLSATLGVTQIFRMDVHPRHGGLIAFGAQDLGDPVSFFGNGSDAAALRMPPNWALVLGGDGRSAAFKRDNSSQVYLANTDTDVARYDGGAATRLLDNGGVSQGPLLSNASLLSLGQRDLRQLLNPDLKDLTTADWTTVAFRPGGTRPATMQSLAICPGNDQVLYAGSTTGEIFSSEDGGQNWTDLEETGLPANLAIWAIAPSPTNCRDVLVGLGYEGQTVRTGGTFHAGDRLWRKADVSAPGPWTGAHGGPQALPRAPVYAIVRHPSAPGALWFVAGDVGVFRTNDGGAHWTNATEPLGLPNTLVRDLRLLADGNTLYAGTFGRGVWRMDVSRPAPDAFGVRGIATFEGRPLSGVSVVVQGAGRIKKWLNNTLTSGSPADTAAIVVPESAFISQALASITGTNIASASLVTPTGDVLPMTTSNPGILRTFSLTNASAAALGGDLSRGSWAFRLTGTVAGSPSVRSAFLDFEFSDGVSVITESNGEYAIEYLRTGSHSVSIFDCDCAPITFDLTSHRTNLDFVLNPTVSVTAAVSTASESGATGRFSVSRGGAALTPLTVNYTLSGTATSGNDYKTLGGSVSIPAGSSSASITVSPVNDSLDEATEAVVLQLSPASGYVVGQPSTATVQILDDDPLPALSINSVTVSEGGTAAFTVSLTPASGRLVTVNVATANGTATGGSACVLTNDYQSQTGSLSFAAGLQSRTMSVPTCTDTFTELSQTFFVNLTAPNNATLSSASGTGTIVEGQGKTGTFQLSPTEAVVNDTDEPLLYSFAWTVPEPLNWHDLQTLDLRIRRGNDILIWVRFDEASRTFALVEDSGKLGKRVAAGSPQRLQTSWATLHMSETSVVGSGPTGPSVTLNLSLSFKPQAQGLPAIVEVAATDDLGNQDEFVQAGTITVHRDR
jgi:photosystem II stability/assembly factor-like uncharacterized protein